VARTVPDLPREYVIAAQRRRAVDAVAEIAHEFGLGAATTVAVCRLGRMARATYYSLFESASGCLRYSFAEAYRQVLGPMASADGGSGWLAVVDAKVEALYASVAANPLLAELCLVHSCGLPEEAAGHDFEATVDEVGRMLSAARGQEGRRPLPLLEEYLARAIVSLAASRALQGEVDELVAERPAMVALVAASYPALEGKTRRP
jgi:hypothetical protein